MSKNYASQVGHSGMYEAVCRPLHCLHEGVSAQLKLGRVYVAQGVSARGGVGTA